jgi:hypothetical protein
MRLERNVIGESLYSEGNYKLWSFGAISVEADDGNGDILVEGGNNVNIAEKLELIFTHKEGKHSYCKLTIEKAFEFRKNIEQLVEQYLSQYKSYIEDSK